MTSVNEMFAAARNAAVPSSVEIALIDVRPQARQKFEDADNTLQALAETIKEHGVIQPVLLRTRPGGRYELVAGERRLRASKLAGLTVIPCFVKTLNDSQARDARLIENIQRLNLTQMEEAEELKATLDDLKGDRDSLAKKYGKSLPWITQRLNLLDLPPQARRLIDENLSADVAAVNNIRQIEKRDPAAAKKLVDQAAAKPGATSLRTASETVKKALKTTGAVSGGGPTVATPRDRSQQEPSAAVVGGAGIFPPAPQKPHEKAISSFVEAAKRPGADVSKLVAAMPVSDRDLIAQHGESFFKRGQQAQDLAGALVAGLTKNEFGNNSVTIVNLLAFLQGQSKADNFSLEAAATVIGAAMK